MSFIESCQDSVLIYMWNEKVHQIKKDSALSAVYSIHIRDFTLHRRDLLNRVMIRF